MMRKDNATPLMICTLALLLVACGRGGTLDDPLRPSVASKTAAIDVGDADCPQGGILVHTGIDEDLNGLLDDDEIDSTSKVCHGETGAGLAALINLSDEAAGSNCAAGGTRVDSGLDQNGNDELDPGEIQRSDYVCHGDNGLASLVSSQSETAGVHCSSGGIRIDSGLDTDADNILDATEVLTTNYVCHGSDGEDGLTSLSVTTVEAAGSNCDNGGFRIDSGLDTSRNGVLESGEVLATHYVCHGNDGANWWEALGLTGSLDGYVFLENGAPAQGASVLIGSTLQQALVDGFGYYRFDHVGIGKHELHVVMEGTHDVVIDDIGIQVAGNTRLRDVRLNKRRTPFGHSLSFSHAIAVNGRTASDWSGYAVAHAGDVNGDGFDDLLIGVERAAPAGEVYLIYGRPGMDMQASLLMEPDVVFSGIAAGDQAGSGISGAGDVNGDGFADVLIGAARAMANALNEAGQSYLIFGSDSLAANIDLANADVTFNGIAENDRSGYSVAGAGDVNDDGLDDLLIGANQANPDGNNGAGETYLVYGKETWAAVMELVDADVTFAGKAAGDHSSSSLAGAGDVNGDGYGDLLIGAPNANPGTGTSAGEVYLVYGAGALAANISLVDADITLAGKAAQDNAGTSVAGAGDVNGDGYDDVLVGAFGVNVSGNENAGEAYLIHGSPSLAASINLSSADFTLQGQRSFDQIGRAVAGVGDVDDDGYADMLIGGSQVDYGGNNDAGEAYLIYGASPLPVFLSAGEADVVLRAKAAGDRAGRSVAGGGDLNGDGFSDLIVGAYHADPEGLNNAGETYLLLGRERGQHSAGRALTGSYTVDVADGRLSNGLAQSHAGYASLGGDVNGDGLDDMLIGAPGAMAGAGQTYLIYGRRDPDNSVNLSLEADVTFNGEVSQDRSGKSVAIVGDVNGDGYDDVLIGAFSADYLTRIDAGKSYLFYGGPALSGTLSLAAADVMLYGAAPSDQSGQVVRAAGDVNRDGFDDFLIGAPEADPSGRNQAGESYLIYGGLSLPAVIALDSADVIFSGKNAGDRSGHSLAGAGDVNGDGYDDLIIGAYLADPGSVASAGESYLVYGGSALSTRPSLTDADVTFTGNASNDQSGYAVSSAGDVNGDGYHDIVIGAYAADVGGNDSGVAYLFYGAAGMAPSRAVSGADVILSGKAADDAAGAVVAAGGDVNADGYDDFLIAAPNADPNAVNLAGETYLIYGGYALNSDLPLAQADVTFSGTTVSGFNGLDVAGGGDVNGDGFADFITSATWADPGGQANTGESYLFLGSGLNRP